ncbi:MAG: hypothetical protein ACI9OH_001416 [Oleispira sp.]|jgi:hypothetical protein
MKTRLWIHFWAALILLIPLGAQAAQDGAINDPGDIAFVAFHDDPDGLSFVLMDDAPDNTSIRFVDEEWTGSAFSSLTGEGEVLWTNNSGSTIAKGTVIEITDVGGVGMSPSHGTAIEADSGFGTANGDQVYAIAGTRAAPGTFLAFVGESQDLNGAETAVLTGTGLTAGTDAKLIVTEGYYSGSTACNSTVSACLQQINGASWIGTAGFSYPADSPSSFSGSVFASGSTPVATAPSAPTVNQNDTNVALADTIQVADSDAGDTQTVTFTITGGTVTTGTTGITFGGSGNGSGSFTAQGSLTNINTALDAATFTPTNGLSGTNAGTISFKSNDGTTDSNTATVTFHIVGNVARTFDWETGVDNGATATQTVSGVTATFTTSNSAASLIDGGGFGGSTANIVFTQYANESTSVTVAFSSAININSVFAFDADGAAGSTWTFTPTGGSNSNVVQAISSSTGSTVTLNWTGVTSFTVTSSQGAETFGFDNIVSLATFDSDGSLTSAAGVTEPVAIDTTLDTVGEAANVFDFTLSDGGTADGSALTVSQIVLNVAGTTSDAQRANVTWRLNGADESNATGVYNAVADTITFSSLSISIADGASEVYTVNAFYNNNSGLSEGLTYILSVDGDTDLTVGSSGTQMGATSAINNSTGSTIDVVATTLAFTTQPAGSVSGAVLTTQPVITARDAAGNIDTDFSEVITLTEASAGSLSGNTKAASAGVATFTAVNYSATADQQSFTLTADDEGGIGSNLPTVDANAVTSDVVATVLTFTTQPAGSVSGNALTTQPVVEARDANGVTDTGFTETITLIESSAGSIVNHTTISVSGVATFSGLAYTATADQQSFFLFAEDQAGVGTDLPTTSANPITSDVVATKLIFDTQPAPITVTSGAATSFTTVPVVSAKDANNVVDSGYSMDIVISEINGAGSALMSGTGDTDGDSATVSLTPTAGVATFTGMQATYTSGSASNENFNLAASASGLTMATSSQLTAMLPVPTITSSTYNATTASLVVTGTEFEANASAADVDVSKLTITGEGGATYTLTTADVERDSATQFTVSLNAADKLNVNGLLNTVGTAADNGTTYNIAAGDDFITNVTAGETADATSNPISVSDVVIPTVTSATYNANTASLVVTGSNFVAKSGANNDVNVNKLIVSTTSSTQTLTSPNVEVSSSTQFTVTLNTADKQALHNLINKNGTSSLGSLVYNLEAAEDWMAASAASSNIVDAADNGITAFNVFELNITNNSPATVFGGLNGSITATISGGAPNYSYVWSNGFAQNSTVSLTSSNEGLAAGAYSITVTDADGFTRDKSSITVTQPAAATLTGSTYNASTGVLVVRGTNLVGKTGAANDIDISKLTLTGQATSAYTITSATDVELDNAGQFTVTLVGADKAAIDVLLNNNGTSSGDSTVYNLSAANGFMAEAVVVSAYFADTTNQITVSGVDNTSPTVSSVSATTANGAYKAGDVIVVTVNFSEAVTVIGTPQLTLETGTTDRTINYNGIGSGTTTLQFAYTVQAGDVSADLDYVATNSLMAGTSIKDAAGNDAILTLAAPGAANSLGNLKAIVVATNQAGSITISGKTIVGESLTAAVADADGLADVTITYQWTSDGNSVGTNSNTYTLQASDLGENIAVNAQYTDQRGTAENITSAATAAIISLQADAVNRISSTANQAGGTEPTVDDYKNAGITDVSDEVLTRILPLINNAIARQSDATDVDDVSKLQALVDVILEGQDNDGDGLPNLVEGTDDTDKDGIADREDTDSDNDGVADQLEVRLTLTDSDSDGIIDVLDADVGNDGQVDTDKVDANFDGVDDALDSMEKLIAKSHANAQATPAADGEAELPFIQFDQDQDQRPNHLDLDSENDGVMDVVESGLNDSNGDGKMDAGDTLITDGSQLLDSDADSLPNMLELKSDGISFDLIVNGLSDTLDKDANGILDSTIDMDRDGIMDSVDNAVGAQGTLPDLDGDGIPNHLDDDDDGDGILDVNENPQQQYFTGLDADADGIDDGVDQNINGVLEGTDTNNNGVRDDRELSDVDNDGIADHLDADSDNDGIPDSEDIVVNVGNDVKSGGAGTMSIMMMLSLLLLSARRYSRSVLQLSVVLLLWLSATISHAENWQVNLGLGQSSLNPDLASGLETSNGNDRAVQLGLGYRISSDWLVELRYADLGDAVIRGNQRHSTLGYQSWVLDTKYQLPLLQGTEWSPYVMGGMAINRLQADDLSLEKKTDSGLMLGAGISYRFQEFQLNSELIRYSDGISGWFMGIQKDF